jgi:hypothetical protein
MKLMPGEVKETQMAAEREIRNKLSRVATPPSHPAPYGAGAAPAAVPVGALRGRLNRLQGLVNRADNVFDASGSIRDRIVGRSDAPANGGGEAAAPNGLLEELDVMLSALDGLLDGTASRLQSVLENISD